MDKFQLQKLRDLPIEGVAERLGLNVVRHKSLCPFHDDSHPSLSFNVRRNSFRCFVCGASGGTIDLVMRYLGKPFLEACRWLTDGSGLTVNGSGFDKPQTSDIQSKPSFDASRYERFFEHPFLNEEARRFLYDERRIDPRVVRWCRLTSWRDRQGVAWLQIPYYDREGRLVGVQNRNLASPNPIPAEAPTRSLSEGGGYLPRFRFPQGSQCGIYNLPVLNRLKPGDALYIAEGCSDCWSLLSAGHKAIAIPSATLLTKRDAELLQHLGDSPPVIRSAAHSGDSPRAIQFHMFPDNDAPGERLFLQLQKVLPTLQHHQLPPGCKDYSEYYISCKNN